MKENVEEGGVIEENVEAIMKPTDGTKR